MERILTAAQMKAADKFTIENLGISEHILVERAALAVCDEIFKKFSGGRVLVCVGKGNNGKDGQVIAKILASKHGFSVASVNVYNGIFKIFDKKFDIIVDCIFGTGLNRVVDGKYKTAIEKINQSHAYVISCDIPSGLNSDTGEIMGSCVKANMTVAIQEYKLGHFLNQGLDMCGRLLLKDIGISVWGDDYVKKINDEEVKVFFPSMNRNVHKGNFGKVAIVGGSKNFCGGVRLSHNALCALKMGCGYSCLAVPESLINVYSPYANECVIVPVKDNDGYITYDENALRELLKYDAITFGMGIGCSKYVYESLVFLINNYTGRLVIDADGINALSEFGIDVLLEKQCDIILTPHVGEFARLLKAKSHLILSDIILYAKDFARKYNVVIAVKSASTIITDGDEVFINTTGCQGMAKGGSGDALSGIIAGLLTKAKPVLDTAAAGCYLFGRAGEIAVKRSNDYCLITSDIIAALPQTINKFLN